MLNSIISSKSKEPVNDSNIPDGPSLKSASAKENVISRQRFHTNNPIKANLRKLGFKEAGKQGGDAGMLRILLQRVYQGVIIDKDTRVEDLQRYKDSLDRKIEKLEKEIQSNRKEILKKETENSTINQVDIPLMEEEIRELKEDRAEKQQEILKELDEKKENKFDRIFYWIVFILAAIYVYLFYISASYSALFRKVDIESMDINSLFDTVFTSAAYTEINFHWILPIVFIALAGLLHLAMESKGIWRGIYVTAVLIAIVATDGLLAFFVESKVMEIKFLTGQVESAAYGISDAFQDKGFYLILVLGSVTCIVWSFIYMKVRSFYSNLPGFRAVRRQRRNLKKKIKGIQEKINGLKKKAATNDSDIKALELDIENNTNAKLLIEDRKEQGLFIPIAQLKNNMLALYQGYMQFVNNALRQDKIQECEAVFTEEFSKAQQESEVTEYIAA